MRFRSQARSLIFAVLLVSSLADTCRAQAPAPRKAEIVVTDETGAAVADAQITVRELGRPELHVISDYSGRAAFTIQATAAYTVRVQKPGFFQATVDNTDPDLREIKVTLQHMQMLVEQVSVSASVSGIDKEQTSDAKVMSVPEIINVPYPSSRDIRNLLPFFPGVISDASGQIHVAGSPTYATLDTLDGFDIRSPVSGNLAMRVSADAVRSIEELTTRYPVQYGRATGGVVAFSTGMGDNKFRFNATNFIPGFQNVNGIRLDKFVPRFTFSGPISRNRAWFFDGLELEYDNIYIRELPANADTDHVSRGSNLLRFQVNTASPNILSFGLLYNIYHSPHEGLSSLVPQQSTTTRNTLALLPYIRDQFTFLGGTLLDAGLGVQRIRDGYEPNGDIPYAVTPEQPQGSFFERATSHSARTEGNGALYIPSHRWIGTHNFLAGVDLDRISFDQTISRSSISYLREDRSLMRLSFFPATPPYTSHNIELGAYVQDCWSPNSSLILEPGIRFDRDTIIARPNLSPRIAFAFTPASLKGATKVSAGVGVYVEHTQLEYLERAFAGLRTDTYFAADGVTPLSPPLPTTFSFTKTSLREGRAVNWSVALEQKLPGSTILTANLMEKRVSNELVYANQRDPAGLTGPYVLTTGREDHDTVKEIDVRRTFSHGYALFGAFIHSSAHTNAAIDYVPAISLFGAQRSGPLPWDVPNRVLSWGWLPFYAPWFRKNWDFVYTADWHTGFPYTSINANQEVIGAAGSRRFPNYTNLSPGLEWRFHFRGSHFGLRGVVENINNAPNYRVVNNNVDSPQYGVFTEHLGRAITARIRLISSK